MNNNHLLMDLLIFIRDTRNTGIGTSFLGCTLSVDSLKTIPGTIVPSKKKPSEDTKHRNRLRL